MKLLDIVHPAAQTLVDIARSQDEEVGDGTTSVVVLAGEFLQQSKEFVEERVAPNLIVRGFRTACELAKAKIDELAVPVNTQDPVKMREMLELFAGTSMNSKLIAGTKEFFAKMVVDAVLHLDDDLGMPQWLRTWQVHTLTRRAPCCRRLNDWREKGWCAPVLL